MNLQLCLGFDCSKDVAVGKAEKKKKHILWNGQIRCFYNFNWLFLAEISYSCFSETLTQTIFGKSSRRR